MYYIVSILFLSVVSLAEAQTKAEIVIPRTNVSEIASAIKKRFGGYISTDTDKEVIRKYIQAHFEEIVTKKRKMETQVTRPTFTFEAK